MRIRPGQSLIEIALTTTILLIVTAGLGRLAAGSFAGQISGRQYTTAAYLAREGIEATRSIARASWQNFASIPTTPGFNIRYLDEGSGYYTLTDQEILNGIYTRKIIIEPAYRFNTVLQPNGDGTPPQAADDFTRKVIVTVTWPTGNGTRTADVTLTTFLTRWWP